MNIHFIMYNIIIPCYNRNAKLYCIWFIYSYEPNLHAHYYIRVTEFSIKKTYLITWKEEKITIISEAR